MLFSRYCLLAAASMALRAYSLPTADINSLDIAKRAAVPSPEIIDIETAKRSYDGVPIPATHEERSAEDDETPGGRGIPIIKINHPDKRVAEANPVVAVSDSEFSKKSTLTPEQEEIERRATTMDPTVGIVQELPSGIIIMGIAFMFYAMIVSISMKDTDL